VLFLCLKGDKMNNNKKLPLVDDLKNIFFDFEHGKVTINDFDVGHCTELSVIYQNNHWKITAGIGNESITLLKNNFNN
jgi:hypothetical protein